MTRTWQYLERTEALIGTEATLKLINSKVIIMGVGGVGSYVLEGLVRSGVGTITVVDYDTVDISNINRQLIADISTIGDLKVDVAKSRAELINPDIDITGINSRVSVENIESYNLENYDYVIDAVDDIEAKVSIIKYCKSKDIPIISAMGAGLKLDPTSFEISDIYSTSMCPLARHMRRRLRAEGIKDLKVVYSKEKPQKLESTVIGTMSYVPSVMGLIIAGEVVKELIKESDDI